MRRVAPVVIALLMALSPILGEGCVLRCHHEVACHQTSTPAGPVSVPCHQSASAPPATMASTGSVCFDLPSSTPAVRPNASGASARAGIAVATVVANALSVRIAALNVTFVSSALDSGGGPPRTGSIPLRV
jgi:hypothetical protein